MNPEWLERIEKLERNEARLARENRRMRGALTLLVAVAVCGLLAAAADDESASDTSAAGAAVSSAGNADEPGHIRARSITIVDADGRERIRLESLDTEAGLFLTDEEWKNLNDMEQGEGLTGIALADSDGARRAAMWTYDKASADLLLNGQADSASVLIRGATGGGSLFRMNEASGKHQIVLAASDQIAQMGVVGGHEERGVSIASSAEAAEMRVSGGKASPTSLVYSTHAGGGHSQMIFQHRPADSPLTPSLAVGVAPNARPALNLYDREGKRRAAAELSADGEPTLETLKADGSAAWSSAAPAAAPAPVPAPAAQPGDESGPVNKSGFSMKPGRIIPNPPPASAPAPASAPPPEAPPAPQPPVE